MELQTIIYEFLAIALTLFIVLIPTIIKSIRKTKKP
jgi:hypothetical protein